MREPRQWKLRPWNMLSGGAETLSREQFDEFYKRTAPTLRANIHRVSGNAAAADDFLQEACMRMLDAPPLTGQ